LWENGRLECLVHLTKWQDLLNNITAELENEWNNVFQPKYLHPYLDHLMQSATKSEKAWPELLKLVHSAEGENRDLLEREYCPELAFLFVAGLDEIGRSRYYVNKHYSNFVLDWAALPAMSYSARHTLLQTLQKVRSITYFTYYSTPT